MGGFWGVCLLGRGGGDGRGLAVTGDGGRGGSQTYLGPRARRAVPGDMMMYRVSPACGGCGRSFFTGRPRGPVRAGGLTVLWWELAAVFPIG